MLRRRAVAEVVYYDSPLLASIGVPHAFSTRLGGVSPAPFDSLNLGNPSQCGIQDDSPRIQENFRLLQSAIACAHRDRVWVHQVHGPAVESVLAGHPFDNGRKADALISDDPTRLLSIRMADCVPILLASGDGRFVAAIHAGWRGVVAGVVPEALRRLTEFAAIPPAEVAAAIGPCIGAEAFEVGPEVTEEFRRALPYDFSDVILRPIKDQSAKHSDDSSGNSMKATVDLRPAVQRQLLRGGLLPDRIDTTDRCTFRDRDEFFSHRRERGVTGRHAALIGCKA